MATSEIRTKLDAAAAFSITLAGLANAAARQSTLLANTANRPAALIAVRLKSNASAPTVGTVYEIYLLRNDGAISDDNAGGADAAITIENAPLLGTIVVTATADKSFYGIFDTSPLGPLGPSWGIAIKNSTGFALNATENTHSVRYTYYVPEAQ